MGSPKKRPKSEMDDDEENENDCCGICYVERNGGSIAGEIDCCNHFFCFVCIMEWAKHESRCPICRQRFSNVRRPPKLGLFSSSRDVKVPLRDQAYHPYGNMTTGPAVSHAEAQCSICHGAKDENLLVICDLCDTTSHTYCVGLGYTVPEDDWFCPDCAISREIKANQESDQQNGVPTDDPTTPFDIVRESSSQVVRGPRAYPLLQNQSSPFVIPLRDRVRRFKGKTPGSGPQQVQRNIQALRENWNALRSGSLRFSSVQSSGTGSHTQDSSSLSRRRSDESHSMGSTSLPQSTVEGGPSASTLNGRRLQDVDKAWKMLDRAKTTQRTHQRTNSVPLAVDRPSYSGVARKISSSHSNNQELKNQQSRTLDLRCSRMENQCARSSLNKNLENMCSSRLGKNKQSKVMHEEMIQHMTDHTAHPEGYREPPLSGKVHTSIQSVRCHGHGERNVANEPSSSSGLATSSGSALSHGKFGSVFSTFRNEHIFNEDKRLAKSFVDGNTKRSEVAKTGIQSLVKQNLKALTRDKQLDVDTFKVIARKATHTILAACTSEQQKSNIHTSSSVCSHAGNTLHFQKSTLMSNCCQQCFHAFVNNVVSSVMLEKVGRV